MNHIAVATNLDGTQQLHTVSSIDKILCTAGASGLKMWARIHGVKDVDIYNMDGTKVAWILKGKVS